MTVGLLRELIPNQGQAWELMLEVLGRYFEEVQGEAHRLDKIDIDLGLRLRPERPGGPRRRPRGHRLGPPDRRDPRPADRRDAPGPGQRPRPTPPSPPSR